ncbi:AAA family ATPase [Agrococcus sp. TSP3-2-1]|uniref:AAA family ATPase n=1 Tax=Agrococcus sp. TSP3-2-1 TaxID=2804583 RepID=UPI003CFA0806
MRLLRLELAGFGPYRGRFEIDFASFEADGVYLIAGPTGAGKSTILDAVCFALYGSAPRYDERAHLRSDLAGPDEATWVELDVRLGDRVLRVRRSPEYERPKQRGSGTTREKAQATLLERTPSGWDAIATTAKEVGHEVARLVGLTKDEFLQVTLLAQGGFAEFLGASSDERKALLERLFGTGSMRRLRELALADAKAVGARRAELEQRRDDRVARVRALIGPADDVGDAAAATALDGGAADERSLAALEDVLTERLRAAAAGALAAAEAEREARAARDAARALADRVARRDGALAALAALRAAEDAVAADRERLADADRAADAAAEVDRWTRADRRAQRAATALEAATAVLPEGLEPERAAVEREREAALDDVARASETSRFERELPQLERAAEDAERDARTAEEAVEAARRERAGQPEARDALVRAREDASTRAAGAEPARAAVEAAEARLEARERADRLREREREASAEAGRTAAAQHAAADALQRLQAARIAGMAGELAGALVAGEPCPVCGAIEHPSPHAPGGDIVTADDVADAIAASEAALAATSAANEALAAVERERASLEAVAGVADRDALAAALEAARDARRACLDATAERERLGGEIERHDDRSRELDARIAELDRVVGERRAAAASAATRLADALARVRESLGGHPDGRSMLQAASTRRDALEQWLEADAERARAGVEQAEAAADGRAALERLGLPDREALAAMRLEPAERLELRERIRAHDDELASARGVLAQPELQGLPESADDVAPLDAALAEAEAASALAARAEATAQTRLDHAATDLDDAREAIRSLADGAEHAATVRALADALDGRNELRQDIETYVLAARLGTIIEAANLRLGAMTEGRFALLHDEGTAYRGKASGLGIQVLDAHTGRARTTKSLSGGETFLASLALALGLADVVQAEAGGISLETLFVDEGFGSLDQDSLEAALSTLDGLRAGGRSVGVISHVQHMQERIPWRIRVVPVPGGGSRIEVAGSDSPDRTQGAALRAG